MDPGAVAGSRELAYDFLRQLQSFIYPKSATPDLLEEIAGALRADQAAVLEATPEWKARWQHSSRGVRPVGDNLPRALFGEAGGVIAAALVLASVVGCLNATILVGPRIAYAMALDGYFFRGVHRVHHANRTPHVAIAAQALTAIVLIHLGSASQAPSSLRFISSVKSGSGTVLISISGTE